MSANVFIATTGNGIARAERTSDDQWAVGDLLTDQDVRCLAADPLDAAVVYAGTQGQGVLRSADAGRTWQPVGLEGQIVKALAVSRVEPGTVYAGTKPARLYVSRDGGTKWTELESLRHIPGRRFWFSPAELPFSAYVQGIALSPTDRDVVVVGIEAGAVVRSTDGGRTWTGHRSGALRDCHCITFHAASGDWVYEAGGTGAGAAASQNAGEQFTQQREGLDRSYGWACAADPADPEVWYASASPMPRGFTAPPAHIDGKANAAIYRKRGAGRWENLAGGLPQPIQYMAYALLTDAQQAGHLYAGLANGDVWHTADYGDSWKALPFNLKSIHRSMIMM